MNNRSRNDILSEMLGALAQYGETSRTRIMYHAMLSNDQSKAYILFLLERGLITSSPDNPKFLVITKKGRELLDVINEMSRMVDYHRGNLSGVYPYYTPVEKQVERKWAEPVVSTIPMVKQIPGIQRQGPGKEIIETAQLIKDKVRERRNVKALWESGVHSDTQIASTLSLTRGVVYNHLRGLGLKPKLKKG